MEGGKCGNMLCRNWLQPVPREAVGAEGGGGRGRAGLDIPGSRLPPPSRARPGARGVGARVSAFPAQGRRGRTGF